MPGGVVQVAAGSGFCLALSAKQSQLYLWGKLNGHLGEQRFAFPVKVDWPANANPAANVLKMAASPYGGDTSNFAVLLSDGTVFHGHEQAEAGAPPKLTLCEELVGEPIIDIAVGTDVTIYLAVTGRVYSSGRGLDHGPFRGHKMLSVLSHTGSTGLEFDRACFLVPGLQNIARVFASYSEAAFLQRDGTLLYATGQTGVIKTVSGVRFSDVAQITDGDCILGYVLDAGAEVQPRLQLDQPLSQLIAADSFELERIQQPLDEDCVVRDLRVYTDDEEMLYRWRVPKLASFRPLEVTTLVLGSVDSTDLENGEKQLEGVSDSVMIFKPDYATPAKGKSSITTEHKMKVSVLGKTSRPSVVILFF